MDVRNPDGYWVNSQVFREEALHFLKNGYYTPDPWGTPDWVAYWEEQLRRCREGYEVGGVRITGHHYFYLNFCMIQLTEKGRVGGAGDKTLTFPHFWDYDYEYFHTVEIARRGISKKGLESLHLETSPLYLDGGRHLIVGKARRKGYSFKNGAICANTFNSVRGSTTLIGAFDKKFIVPKGTMTMASSYINFLNEHTGWAKKRDYVDQQMHRRASYEERINGMPIEKGYKSDIIGVTFKDNPDAARGKDAQLILFEEAGKFPNLKASYMATKPTLEDGAYVTGQIIIFGCVCAGTEVWDKEGRKTVIERISNGTGILGYEGEGLQQEPVISFSPVKKECYRITTEGGKSIECSHDHPLLWSRNRLVKGGKKLCRFKRARDIKAGDQLMSISEVPVFGTKQMWQPRLVGLLIGDGFYGTGSPELSIDREGVFEWVDSEFETTARREYETSEGNTYRSVTVKGIQDELRGLGVYGQSKSSKTFPPDIHLYDKESICELLGGYFDADGNVNYSSSKDNWRVVLSSVHRHLLESAKDLLLKLGVGCNIFKEYRKGGYKEGDIYRLYVSKNEDIRQFAKNIKFLSADKQEKLVKAASQGKKSRGFYPECSFEFDEDIGKGSYYLQKRGLRNLKSNYVVSVEPIGVQEVYNINAGITNTYITNGFVSGNTGGDMERGTVDFAEMFYNPNDYNMLPFENIWDNSSNAACSFFVPDFKNKPGFVDSQGNSLVGKAKKFEEDKRSKLSGDAYNGHIQEYPFTPSEAFLVTSYNEFPVQALSEQLERLKTVKELKNAGQPVYLYRGEDGVTATPDLEGKLQPIDEYPYKGKNLEGAVVIYEFPLPDSPKGLYRLGYDPYRQDQSTGVSLGAVYVYKAANTFSYTRDMIVAEYVGRPSLQSDFDEKVELLAEYYGNAQIMHENEVPAVKSYFQRRKKLHLLAFQPDEVIKANIKKSGVSRVYGIHMNTKLKDAAERYIKQWLLTERDTDENGKKLLNLHFIYSKGLVEELIKYDRQRGNFDRVMALAMIMFHLQEDDLGKTYDKDPMDKAAQELNDLIKSKYTSRWPGRR